MIEQSRLACRLGAEDGNKVVVEAGLRDLGKLEIGIEVGTNRLSVSKGGCESRAIAYLKAFSSSITCIPFSYCSFVGASPTEAK